jgi:hypothetical protein
MLSKPIPLGIYEKALPAGECWLERLRLAKALGLISSKCRSMKLTPAWPARLEPGAALGAG